MSRLLLVTGGARSGKSTFAEGKAKECGQNVLYVATSKPIDDEMKQRIAKHKAQRPSEWETLEEYKNLDFAISNHILGKEAVLLDCITIMITNLMFEKTFDWDSLTREEVQKIETSIQHQIERLIGLSKMSEVTFVIVTNEIGLGIVPATALSRDFRDIAGRMNQLIAGAADEVYFCVSGIPMKIK
jgi:adenosylcobinamide kinase/adenosylcobinamide-phosphate guanylyltransferase